jgi:hypothetical protein
MKDYYEHEKMRFSYMTIRQLRTRLNKITDRQKLYWFGRVAEEVANGPDHSWAQGSYRDLARDAMRRYNGIQETKTEITTFLDPALFEWNE